MAAAPSTRSFLSHAGVTFLALLPFVHGAEDSPASLLREPSFEELAGITITSVSKQEEQYFSAAASVHVISADEIRRSGVRLLPEAFRLAPGVEVAAINSRSFAVTMRGFNGTSANKLLPMIDGRSLYSQRFAGTIWDVRELPLEEVEQIEVIGGPGGTTWGANAVNGVINIITKDARHTQGDRLVAGGGSYEDGFFYGRHGFAVGENAWARVYVQAFARDDSDPVNVRDNNDAWGQVRAGLRYDADRRDGGQTTVTSDIFYSGADQLSSGVASRARSIGGHVLARHEIPVAADHTLRLQAYVDILRRNSGGNRTEADVLDLDALVTPAAQQPWAVSWGVTGRLSRLRDLVNSAGFTSAFDPEERWFKQAAVFAEATARPTPEIQATVGVKAEYNDFTGLEPMPSLRFSWMPRPDFTWWAAASLAARIPSRFENDQLLTAGGGGFVVRTLPSPDLRSEILRAYETGWRWRRGKSVGVDVTLYHHDYARLVTNRTVTTLSGSDSALLNEGSGTARGLEAHLLWMPTAQWQLQLVYSYLDLDLHLPPTSNDASLLRTEYLSPKNQLSLMSSWNFGPRWEVDVWYRAVGALNEPARVIPSYTTADIRLGYQVGRGWEVSVVGQNLLEGSRREFRFFTIQAAVPRGWYARVEHQF